MTNFSKNLFAFTLVALVSSGVSVGVYSLLNRDTHSYFGQSESVEDSSDLYSKPVTFQPVAQRAAVETDFTQAAESTVNAVVSIKTIATPKNMNGSRGYDPFLSLIHI